MNKKLLTVLLVFVISASSVITGCGHKETGEIDTQDVPVVRGEKNGVLNHGHSISETSSDRPFEIRRSDDVIMDQNEAQKYLEESVILPDSDMRFALAETSDNDPGAYMWYGFYIFKNNICISNNEFTVIAFTDGTICEGRQEVLSCTTFVDPDDMIGPDAALDIYKKESGDSRDFSFCFNRNYEYQQNTNECILTYMYRYDNGNPSESYTLLLNAVTGAKVGYWADEIS